MWSRMSLRAKILATHLLVAAAPAAALLLVLALLALGAPLAWPFGLGQVVPVPALVAAVLLAGVAAAVVAGRWLFEQVARPVRRARFLTQRIAKGQYAEATPPAEQLPLSADDDLRKLLGSIEDLARSLADAERRRTELFGEITHELRTPVAILEGYFEGLLDGHVKPSDKTWAMLYDEASRVHRLVDDLQRLSRAEARLEPPDLQAVHPADLVQAAEVRMRLHFDEKGLQITTNVAPDLPPVLADPDHALQVQVNLLTNALRYTSVPGKVTLSVDRMQGGNEVVFRVADTGIGIAAEHVPHLFDRFFRVDRSGRHGTGGSGIGLPVAKALVEGMGGRIWAESQAWGRAAHSPLHF